MIKQLLKKKLLRFAVLLAVVLSTALQASALESFEVDYTSYRLRYDIIGDSEVSVKGSEVWLEGNLNIEIPEIVTYNDKEYRVTSIKSSAFVNSSGIKSIIIPESVTSIGDHAFWGCYSLTSIIIPDSVTSIEGSTFWGCSALTSITIPKSVASIGYQAFCNCSSLTSITIPKAVTSIGDGAFCNCKSMESILVEEYNSNYSSVDGILFSKSKKILVQYPAGRPETQYTIPTSVSTIKGHAFSGCSSLTSITIPNSITSIKEQAFNACSSLKKMKIYSDVFFPSLIYNTETVLAVPTSILNDYKAAYPNNEVIPVEEDFTLDLGTAIQYTYQDVPLNYKVTGESTVEVVRNTNVSGNVIIPEEIVYNGITYSVTSIGIDAFEQCYSLTSVFIPRSVTTIDQFVFYECTGLESISVDEDNLNFASVEGVLFDKGITSLIQYPIGRKNETYTIPNTVTSIGEYAFKFCKNLISVVIPNSVTSLGHSAFNTCTSLQSIALPNSIILIDTYAFYNCTSLESISVDENNPNYASVEGVLFDKAITSLIQYPIGRKNDTYTIPNTVTSIGELAFKFCKNLTSVSIPNSVTTIGSKAFDTCSSLLSVTIPNSVISLGERAFAECTSLKSISLSNSVKAIGNHAFAYCKSLNSIIIPSSVTSIEESTFYDCEALASISIPNSVTSIGFRAFWYCFSLKSLFIPSSVTSIGEQAFNVCSSLESITVDDRNTNYSSLDGALFDKDKKILIQYPIGKKDTKYVIPSSVISVGKRAFYRGESLNTIIISNSVLSIDEWAFSYCTSLSSLTIPNSVTSINNSFLHGKNNLKLLKVKSNQVFIGNLNVSNTVLAENVVLAVPKNKFNEYREAYPNNKVISVDEVGFEPESYELAVKPSVLNTLSLFIDAFENVNGFQMDVTLPEGLAIAEVDGKLDVSFGEGAAAASHTLTASKVTGSNKYRIVAYSSKNEPFLAGEDLLNIAVEADENFKGGEINVSDVFISTTDGEGYQGIDFSINANVDYALSIGDDISLEEGETWQLAPAVNPSIEDLTLEWASTNPDVAYVDADGMLHAVTPGEAVITASNSEYGISASINVTVTPILYGDANDNGIVTIDDVVTDVQYILEKDPQPFSFRKADVNKDTRINILDVSKTVAIVLANEEQPQALRAHLCGVVGPSASLSAENIRLDADGRAVMTLRLNGDADITALQGDICLPEGVRVSNISMAGEQKGDHIISFAELKSGATRFAVYSMSLASVTANSALIEVELESENLFVEGEASVDDIYVSDTDCNLLRMESVSVDVSGASAVNEISSDPNAPADVYNMQGVLILRNATQSELNALTPGLYIVNGKKIQIR